MFDARARRLALGLLVFSFNAFATDANFTGSTVCAECHQAEYQRWLASDHRNAMLAPDESAVLGDFADARLVFHDIETRFYRDGEDYRVSTIDGDGKRADYRIAWTFGHDPLQQYLVDIGDGHLQALNHAWDSRPAEQGGQRWYHLQPDEKITPEHPFFWTRHTQNANSRCIECHATDVRKNYDADKNAYATSWVEASVGCESCHGPASRHVALARSNELSGEATGFSRQSAKRLGWRFEAGSSIAAPVGKKDDSYLDTCGGCHSRRGSLADIDLAASYHDQYRLATLDPGLYFADGQIHDEVFVLGSFLQSKMAAAGVTCNNCHEPHSGKTLVDGNALCAQCHLPTVYDTTEHHRHPENSTGAACVECHMPARTYMQIDDRRDHGFSIPRPAQSAKLGSPDACTTCHADQDAAWAVASLEDWGIAQKPDDWSQRNHALANQDALALQRYARQGAAPESTPIRDATLTASLAAFQSRLTVELASRQLASTDPLLRRAAVSALAATPLQIRWPLLQPLIADPARSVRLEVAPALADALPQLGQQDAERLQPLLDEYRAYLAYIADTPGGQLSLGNLESRLGYPILAERAYRRALEIEPAFVPALINLADLLRTLGADREGQALLERALVIAPDSAAAQHAYGLYLIRAGRRDEALERLQRATALDDASPRHAYVYAVALDSIGNTSEAIDFLDAASRRWPNQSDLAFLQVAYRDKLGVTEGIAAHLSVLIAAAPENPQVAAWRRKYPE